MLPSLQYSGINFKIIKRNEETKWISNVINRINKPRLFISCVRNGRRIDHLSPVVRQKCRILFLDSISFGWSYEKSCTIVSSRSLHLLCKPKCPNKQEILYITYIQLSNNSAVLVERRGKMEKTKWTRELSGYAWLRIKCKHARCASVFSLKIKY